MLRFLLSVLLWASRGVVAQAAASDLAVLSLPQCAQTCLFTAVALSPCGLTDSACICAESALQTNITNCVLESCTTREALTTRNATSSICHIPIRDRSNSVRISNLAIASIADAVAVTRLAYNAFVSKLSLGWDDYTVLISIIVGAPSVAIIDRVLIPNGLGKDIWTVPFNSITISAKWLYILEVLYFAQIMVVKLTLLFFFLRIFQKSVTKRILKATIAFDLIWGTAFVFAAMFQCQPFDYFWNMWDTQWRETHPGKCVNINALAWNNAAISLVLDFWMLVIPLYEVFHLQLSIYKKFSISVMFFFGTFVTVISMLRLRSLITFAKSKNPTWDQFEVVQWSNAEIDIAIICACLPALRSMVLNYFPNITGSKAGSQLGASSANNMTSLGTKRSATATAMRKTPDAIFMETKPGDDEISLVRVESYGVKKSSSITSY